RPQRGRRPRPRRARQHHRRRLAAGRRLEIALLPLDAGPGMPGTGRGGSIMRTPVHARRLAAAVSLSLIAACATNPATGKKQIMLVGEAQEIAMGQEADKQVASTLGLYPDEALRAYVSELGKGLAAKGERPSLPWTFRVVDDPTVN